jgi:hypothetical protein
MLMLVLVVVCPSSMIIPLLHIIVQIVLISSYFIVVGVGVDHEVVEAEVGKADDHNKSQLE